MSKWLAVMALGAAMAAVGCDNNKSDSGEPMKMSGGAAKCGDCDKAAKAAEPKKLSAGAKSDCQTKCPSEAAKAK
jgi:hypothetical protein